MKALVSGDRHRGANERKANRCSPSRTRLTLGGGACLGNEEESGERENRLRARKDFFLSLERPRPEPPRLRQSGEPDEAQVARGRREAGVGSVLTSVTKSPLLTACSIPLPSEGDG